MIARVWSVIESVLFLPVLILDNPVIVVVDFVPFGLLVDKHTNNDRVSSESPIGCGFTGGKERIRTEKMI